MCVEIIAVTSLTPLYSLFSVREELIEKKCFAELLCKREAMRFYHSAIRKLQECSARVGKMFIKTSSGGEKIVDMCSSFIVCVLYDKCISIKSRSYAYWIS